MSAELIAILTLGVTLAGGQLGAVLWLTARMDRCFEKARADARTDVDAARAEMRSDMQQFRAEMRSDMEQFRAEMRSEMEQFRAEMRSDVDQLRTEMRSDSAQLRAEVRALETRVASVEQGQARLEGLVDGLREAIAGRAPAA